jgi:hypothetical protein
MNGVSGVFRRLAARLQRQPTPVAVTEASSSYRSPYQDRPKSQFWRTGVAETDPHSVKDLYKSKFPITRDMRVATAGSCFAQHIGRRLRERGFNILEVEPAPPLLTPESAARYGYGIYSARYGNIYLTRQLLQLAQEALGKRRPDDIAWSKDGRIFDALRPAVEPAGYDSIVEMLTHRNGHLQAVRRVLSEAELFVFTFGLTEGWVHRPSQTVYPTAPGTIAGRFDPAIHEFKNFTFGEILADFLAFRDLVRAINPGIRFLLTVSPVPLTATASNDHVLPATTYSKAVLRAVTGQLHKEYADIDYFPSFEVISSHWSKGSFFEPNLRDVTPEGVDAVMRIFFAEHDPDGREIASIRRGTAAGSRPKRSSRPRRRQREDVVCEEVMLEAFNK